MNSEKLVLYSASGEPKGSSQDAIPHENKEVGLGNNIPSTFTFGFLNLPHSFDYFVVSWYLSLPFLPFPSHPHLAKLNYDTKQTKTE